MTCWWRKTNVCHTIERTAKKVNIFMSVSSHTHHASTICICYPVQEQGTAGVEFLLNAGLDCTVTHPSLFLSTASVCSAQIPFFVGRSLWPDW